MPEISVILPAFNVADVIGRAIASIRAQTFQDWELIVVDDGSNDSTLALLERLESHEPRLQVVTRPHTGIVGALNCGLDQARGRLIARMDADDDAYPDRLAEQAFFLLKHPEIGLVGSLVDFGGDQAAAAGYALHVDWINSVLTPEQIFLQRFVESPLAHPSVMFRRELIRRHGGYREGHFPEDYELWLRWLEGGVRMAKVPRVLLRWHDSSQRLSRQDSRYETEAFYRCKATYLARWFQTRNLPQRSILVWGAGRPTRKRAEYLSEQGVRLAGYIDIDPAKIGRTFSGRLVLGPEQIPPPDDCFILGYVAKRGARDLARAYLASRAFVEGRDFLMAA